MNDIQHDQSASRARRTPFDTYSYAALLAGLSIAILLFIPGGVLPTLFSKTVVLCLATIISLAAFILARLSKGNVILPPVGILGALWLIPAAYVLSSLFSSVPLAQALLGTEVESDTLAFVVVCGCIATLAAITLRRSQQYRIFFLTAAIVSGIVLLSEIIFFALGLSMPLRFGTTANLIGTFTDMGMFVGLILIVSQLALRFLTLEKRTQIFLWTATGLSLVILAIVNSTLIWSLVSLASFGLFIEAVLRRPRSSYDEEFDEVEPRTQPAVVHTQAHSHSGLGSSLTTLIISLFFLIGGQTIGASLTNAFGAGYIDVRPSWQATFLVGSHTYASSPIFGSGPGTFGQEWLKYRDHSVNDTIFWNIDFTSGIGYIPTSGITTGIIGALAWIVFLGLFWYVGIRSLMFSIPEDRYIRFTAVASFISASYLYILAICTVPGMLLIALAFLSTGIFVSTLRYAGEHREWGIQFANNPRVGFVIVFVLTLILLGGVVAAYSIVERYMGSVAYAEAIDALGSGDVQGAATYASRSLVYAPTDRTYQLTVAVGIQNLQRIAALTTLTPAEVQQQFQSTLSETITRAKEAIARNPKEYRNWMALASVYQVVVPLNIDGAFDNAMSAYTEAARLNPSSPAIPYAMAQLNVSRKDYPAAEKNLIDAISLKRDYPEAIFLLSQIQVQQGKAREALQTAEAAAYFAPGDANVQFQVGILRSGTGDQAGAEIALRRALEASPNFANARFFLAVVLEAQGKSSAAKEQLETLAALSADNAAAVAPYIAALDAGKNPFPKQSLGALGVTEPQVVEKQAP